MFISSEQETSRVPPAARTPLEIAVVLTVVAVGPRVGRHGAVAGEVLPLLDAHAHVGAGVLLAGGARAWEKGRNGERKREAPQEKKKTNKKTVKAVKYIMLTTRRQHAERERNATPVKRNGGRRGVKQWHHRKLDAD